MERSRLETLSLAEWRNRLMPTTRARHVLLLQKQLANMSRYDQVMFLRRLEQSEDREIKEAVKDYRHLTSPPKSDDD